MDFEQRYYAPGTRQERKRERYVAHLDFLVRDAVLTAVNMGRDADTTAAVAGALAGAAQGASAIPEEWASAIGPARGSCLPAMAGLGGSVPRFAAIAAKMPESSGICATSF